MFDQAIGSYFVETNLLTKEQFNQIILTQRKSRLKLGFIAINKGFITEEQANHIHNLQKKKDMKFGDIAIREGYLTKVQLDLLLQEQGVASLIFIQTMNDLGYLTLDQINAGIERFKRDRNMTEQEYDDLYSSDITRIANAYLNIPESHAKYKTFLPLIEHKEYFTLFLRNIIRFVSSDIKIYRPEKITSYECKYMVYQPITGKPSMFAGIGCQSDVSCLLKIASGFGEENFTKFNEDSADAAGEFLNCVDGLYLNYAEEHGIFMDMKPQEYVTSGKLYDANAMYKMPLFINYKACDLILCIGNNPLTKA